MRVQCSLFDYFNGPIYKPAKAIITFISVCEKAKSHEIAYIPKACCHWAGVLWIITTGNNRQSCKNSMYTCSTTDQLAISGQGKCSAYDLGNSCLCQFKSPAEEFKWMLITAQIDSTFSNEMNSHCIAGSVYNKEARSFQ